MNTQRLYSIKVVVGALLAGFVLGVALTDEITPKKTTISTQSIDQATSISPTKSESTPTNGAIEKARVTKVIDGDTIKLDNGKIVRYIGINTPETVDYRRPVQCYGHEASEKNKQLVEGKEVQLTKDVSETDKYGRLLRFVYLDGVFINDLLVRQGFALASTYPPDVKFSDQFLQAQKEAQENNRGLWTACPLPKSSPSPATSNQTSNDKDCSDFKTQAEAQAFFIAEGGPAVDPHRLDSNHDGTACESLP